MERVSVIWSADDSCDGSAAADLDGASDPDLLGASEQFGSLGPLPALQRRLDGCASVGKLLAVASFHVPHLCGFTRGIVLSVLDGHLGASGMEPIGDHASDAWRRQCQEQPIALLPGSEEAEVIRRAQGGSRERSTTGSVVARALGLERYALAAVAPESVALALVIVDRPQPNIGRDDRAALELFAHLLGLAIIRTVLRLRIREISATIQQLTASANAMINEAHASPVTLTTDLGQGPVFAAGGQDMPPSSELGDLLSDRERDVAGLMVRGLSNRQIGEALDIAPDTVKVHVSHLLRKLRVSNRVEAVARYIELQRRRG